MTTDKQKQARERNWLICRLRGLHSSVPRQLNPADYAQITMAIDHALANLGAESEYDRQVRICQLLVAGDFKSIDHIRSFRGKKRP